MPPPANISSTKEEHAVGVEAAWASGWTAPTARAAVDSHKRGQFTASWQLQIDAPSYPPIKAALDQRISKAKSAQYCIEGPTRAPGRIEVEAAKELWKKLSALMRSTFRDRAMMGLSVWQHPIKVNHETLRHEVTTIERWPIAAVEYSSSPFDGEPEGYYAILADGERVRLPAPGTTDGHWTVVGEGDQPHLDGAICALDMCFVAGQLARRNFANLISTAGKASVVVEMAPNTPTTSDEGTAMLEMAKSLGTKQSAAVHAYGGKVYPFEVTTQTGTLLTQVTEEQARMVAWALLGHDSTISRGDVYNDPTSQSVPEDLTREDVEMFVRAVCMLLELLSILNAGVDVEPPKLVGKLPDSDQDAREKALDERNMNKGQRLAAMHAAVKSERESGCEVTQARLDQLAEEFDVPVPTLAAAATPGDAIFAYDLDACIITINEQRRRKGEGSVAWGNVTAPEAKQRITNGWTTSITGWVPPMVAAPNPAQSTPAPDGQQPSV